ncbi:MAG: choice-of-anchor tandem repeat GloVer-containing protein [Candidatus Korobacteraceae bacterium]
MTNSRRRQIGERNLRRNFGAYGLVFLMIVFGSQLHAQTFTVLHSFGGNGDGYEPLAGVAIDAAGNLYGTTAFGGNEFGIVYKLSPRNSSWIYSRLFDFTESGGDVPIAKVAIAHDGSLYGSATQGGTGSGASGTVFRLRPSPTFCASVQCPWEATVVHTFSYSYDGGFPGPITFDSAGNIYGTTSAGGVAGIGTVYKLTSSQGSWTFSVLTGFAGTGAGSPYGGVILDQNGNAYGEGYGDYPGTVFEVTSSGDVQILHQFDYNDGIDPFYGMVFDTHGNLYGQTAFGGMEGEGGTMFELSPSGSGWTFNLLYSFAGVINNGTIGAAGVTMDAQGNVYGTTFGNGAHNYGTVYKLTPSDNGWIYTDLYDFTGGDDGCYPWSDVVMDSRGNLYGTASECGQGGLEGGTVWEITP